jgi:hypothetical protein
MSVCRPPTWRRQHVTGRGSSKAKTRTRRCTAHLLPPTAARCSTDGPDAAAADGACAAAARRDRVVQLQRPGLCRPALGPGATGEPFADPVTLPLASAACPCQHANLRRSADRGREHRRKRARARAPRRAPRSALSGPRARVFKPHPVRMRGYLSITSQLTSDARPATDVPDPPSCTFVIMNGRLVRIPQDSMVSLGFIS